MTKEPLMIAVYLRVSTEDHQDTRSQKFIINEWIKKQGYPKFQLVWYEDKISGSKRDREALGQLMRDVDHGKIDRLILFDLSRLSRDFIHTLNLMETLTDKGIVVETPSEGVIRFDGTMHKFLIAAKGLVSEGERQNIRNRIKSGMQRAISEGAKFGAKKGEKRRLGYRKDYDKELVDKILIWHERELSFDRIAEIVNVSRSTVGRIIQRSKTA